MIELFTTVVGSHVWRMETPTSDIDITTVRIEPTVDVLQNIVNKKTIFTEGEQDITSYEIGTLIEGLIKCNIDSIKVVLSPVPPIYEYKEYRNELYKVISSNVSKDIFNSTHGLGSQNYRKYIIRRNEVDNQKRINTICRSIQCGITALETGKIKFEPYHGTTEEIPEMLRDIQVARINSSLPEHSDQTKFREFLYNIRMKELNGDL